MCAFVRRSSRRRKRRRRRYVGVVREGRREGLSIVFLVGGGKVASWETLLYIQGGFGMSLIRLPRLWESR